MSKKRIATVFLVASLLVLSLAFLGCSKISDHSEDVTTIQGQWQVVGSTMTCVITKNQIRMPADTVYDYTVDTEAGTLCYSVGNVSGSGAYVLGVDDETGVTTLTLNENLDGQEKVTVFVKLSDDTDAEPSTTGGSEVFSGSATESTEAS